eukprot:jgi/Chrzof1/13021/Cz07g16210.t1
MCYPTRWAVQHNSVRFTKNVHVKVLTTHVRRSGLVCTASSSPFKVQLLHPVKLENAQDRPLLIYLPGTDGTGQAITPQLPALLQAGYDIRCMYLPPEDRSGWDALQAQILYLINMALEDRPAQLRKITLVAESFGGCLGLRIAAAAPKLVRHLVLVNPATSFNRSLSGLSSFVSATNLLGLFPQDMYNTAQAVLLPFLVDIERVGPEATSALKSMIFMEPPQDFDPENWQPLPPSSRRRGSSPAFAPASGPFFAPAAAANFRSNLLRQGDLSDDVLKNVTTPTLVICSAKDRMLPSITEGARLQRIMPRARRVILPDSCHTALLEKNVNLAQMMRSVGFTPDAYKFAAAAAPQPLTREPSKHVDSASGSSTVGSVNVGTNAGIISSSNGNKLDATSSHTRVSAAESAVGSSAQGMSIPSSSLAATATATATSMASVSRVGNTSNNDMSGSNGSSTQHQLHHSGISSTTGDANPASISSKGDIGLNAGSMYDSTEHSTASSSQSTEQVADNRLVAAPGIEQLESLAASSSSSSSSSSGTIEANNSLSNHQPASTVLVKVKVPDYIASSFDNLNPAAEGLSTDDKTSNSRRKLDAAAASRNSTNGVVRRSTAEKQGGNSQQRTGSGNGSKDIDLAWDQWSQYLAPWRDLVSPVMLGLECLPDPHGAARGRPMLFVGNHQKMGLYDMPLLLYELYMRGFKVKGLAHPGHWAGPLGSFFEQFGAVKAGPMTAYKLLRNGEQVLLFPGGAREVNKRCGEEYQLFWRDSPDFVRLAAKCDAIIIPFAAVGADDAYDVMLEADEVLDVPVLGPLMRDALRQVVPSLEPSAVVLPVTRLPGLGLPSVVPVPNLQRLYFKMCEPVDTRQLTFAKNDADAWQQLYNEIKATVVSGMEELLAVRATDEQRSVGARISKAFSNLLPALTLAQQDKQTEQQ